MLLVIYFVFVALLIGFTLIVILNFWRYRFIGDKTGLVLALFTVAFVLVIASTLFLVDPSALSGNPQTPQAFDGGLP